ncbi:hypothetical protein GBAR_LOCUS26369, partial [Geodia barretti]
MIYRITRLFLLIVAFVALVGIRDTSAAITGKISGVVTAEATKAPLADVTVTIVGTSSTTTTNDAGYYVLINIPPGGYDVKTELAGYGTETVAGAKVFRWAYHNLKLRSKGCRRCHARRGNGKGCQTA